MSGVSVINFLSGLTPLSPEFTAALAEEFHLEHFKAHQVIHAGGQPESRLWFLLKGFARSYYFDGDGKEHTLAFFLEEDLIFSYQGYWHEPADRYIEVLLPAELLSISYGSLHRLVERFPETRILMRYFTRKKYEQDTFICRLLTRSAEERYREFRKARPDIFRMASLRLIASHLNMTRENLSRLVGRENR
jgi:CRP/FNR family transcriptional regulator, anaerobic regulatory protein